MARQFSRWIMVVALLLTAVPALAFVRIRHPVNGNLLRRADATGITFLINSSTAPGMISLDGQTTITLASDPLAALRASLDTWTGVSTSNAAFLAPGTTGDSSAISNGENIISFVDNQANRTLVGDALAVTVVTFTSSGQITDTDIIFNSGKTFSTRNEANTFDIQSVATHELGHALGTGHSGLLASTMFYATKPNSSIQARLTADDVTFVTSAYPEPGVLATLAEVSGTLRFLDQTPVFGALVVAMDANTGVAVGNISLPDGSYSIPALPPGSYYFYAEPADGPVSASNLPAFFSSADTNFPTAFVGGSSRQFPIGISGGHVTPLDFAVVRDTPTTNIDFAAATSVGGVNLSNATQGPLQVSAGETFDFLIAGFGLDSLTFQNSDVLLLGAGLTIRPDSIRRNDFINGRPAIRMTVQVAANAPYGVGTVILKGSPQGGALTAVLKVLGAAGGGGGGGGGPVPSALEVTPTSLRFTAPAGSQTVSVGGTVGLKWSAAATTDSGGNWLVLSATSGVVPGSFAVYPIAGDLEAGTYTGHITVGSPNLTAKVVDVTFIILPPPPPLVLSGGVANAASFVGGAVAPGEIVTILGSDMGPRVGVAANPDSLTGALPTTLSGVVVYFSGIPSPLFFVRHDQINAQVPYEVDGKAATELEVEFRSQRSPRLALRVAEARPGVFTVGSGAGQAAALNQDSSPNSPANPALVGSVVQLFLTGQGTVSPAVGTGQPAPSVAPFPAPQRPVRVSIGGVEAPVPFAGLAPGMVGVLQVNAVVPRGFFPSENVPVVVTVGGEQGPTNVTIAVKN